MIVFILVKDDEYADEKEAIAGVFAARLDAVNMQVSFKDEMIKYSIREHEVIE